MVQQFHGFHYGPENTALIQQLQDSLADSHDLSPILITGQSGWGKTLLMELVRQQVPPSHAVRLITGEALLDNLIGHILAETNMLEDYRNLHFLLIDDLVPCKSKPSTQEALLDFFCKLQQQGTQVIVTSLPSRYTPPLPFYTKFPGKTLHMQMPTWATLQAIAESYAAKLSIRLTAEQTAEIIVQSQGNGFLLEGFIKRLGFFQHTAQQMAQDAKQTTLPAPSSNQCPSSLA